MQSLCYLDLPQLCLGTLYHPSVTRGDPLTAPKRPETRPKPTDFPLSTSNVISVQSYHSKNYYAITMLSRPTSTVSRHTISPICDQGGPPHSPKTARNTPQTNRFSYPGNLWLGSLWVVGGWIMASTHPPPCNIHWINHFWLIGSLPQLFETEKCGISGYILVDTI